jgi:hypothetical protein
MLQNKQKEKYSTTATAHFLFFEEQSAHIWHFCKPHKSAREPMLAKQPNYSIALERYNVT